MSHARAAFVGGYLGLVVAIGFGLLAGGATFAAGAGDPPDATDLGAQRATRLAGSISAALNWAAFAALLLVPAGAVWRVRRVTSQDDEDA